MALAPTRFSRLSVGFISSTETVTDLDPADSGSVFSVPAGLWSVGGTDVTSTGAELNIMDGVVATAAEINRAADVSTRIVTHTATGAITLALHEGKINLLGEVGGDAAVALTLPAATGTGGVYRFVVSVVNTSGYTIQVVGDDTIDGAIWTASTGDTPDLGQPWVTAATSDTIILNGTTTGGVAIGDYVELIDIAADQWAVSGFTTSSGAEATPFSAAV